MNSWIKKNYLSHLGIFQCVRKLLQLSLPIDHPVSEFDLGVDKWFFGMPKNLEITCFACIFQIFGYASNDFNSAKAGGVPPL